MPLPSLTPARATRRPQPAPSLIARDSDTPMLLDTVSAARYNAAVTSVADALTAVAAAREAATAAAMNAIATIVRLAVPEVAYIDVVLAGPSGAATVRVLNLLDADMLNRNEEAPEGTFARLGWLGEATSVEHGFLGRYEAQAHPPTGVNTSRFWRVDVDTILDDARADRSAM